MPAFLAPVDYSVGWSPSEVKAGDFNGDDVPDLVTLDPGTLSVSVLLGNGDGTFQPGRYSDAGRGYPLLSLAAGDFNEDGKLDLATGSNLYETYQYGIDDVVVLIGNGDGTFASPAYLGTDLPAHSVVTGDVNGDDHLDFVVTSWDHASQTGSVTVLLGGGDGTFAPATTYDPDFPAQALADFDRDGDLDLAGGNRVALGNGDGTFRQPGELGVYSYSWTVADLDADGDLDLVGDGANVLRGNGDGSFQAPQPFAPDMGLVTAADVNGDGVLDLVGLASGAPYPYLTALLGSGDGSFGLPIGTALGFGPGSLAVADFNADGRPDAAMSRSPSWGSGLVSVCLNDGAWPPDDPPSVSIRDSTVTEFNTDALIAAFNVTLSHTSTVDVTVHFETADTTAAAGGDYTAASGTVTIPAGQTYAVVTVAVKDDRLAEPNETFAVNLTNATGATIDDGQGIGTILDNEPRIGINDVSRAEGRKGGTTLFTFTVTLSAAYDQPVTVSFRTVTGTATTTGADYVARSGTLTFAPGQTTRTITIEVMGDNKREADETFFIDLTGLSTNVWPTRTRGIGTIWNDD